MTIDYRTFADMYGFVGRQINDSSESRKTKIKESLNYHYREICRFMRWPELIRGREETLSFTGSRWLYLPKDVDELFFMQEGSIPNVLPHEAVEQFFANAGDSFDTTGTAFRRTDAGEIGRKFDFSSTAEKITISSSTSTDSNTVVIHGEDSNGDDIKDVVALPGNGTSVDSTTTFSDLFSVSCDGSQTGTITAAGKTSATTYATIPPNERTARYWRVRIRWVPQSGQVFTIYYKRRVAPLVNDQDVMEIRASYIAIEFATASQYLNMQMGNFASFHENRAKELLSKAQMEHESQVARMIQATPYPFQETRHSIIVPRSLS